MYFLEILERGIVMKFDFFEGVLIRVRWNSVVLVIGFLIMGGYLVFFGIFIIIVKFDVVLV